MIFFLFQLYFSIPEFLFGSFLMQSTLSFISYIWGDIVLIHSFSSLNISVIVDLRCFSSISNNWASPGIYYIICFFLMGNIYPYTFACLIFLLLKTELFNNVAQAFKTIYHFRKSSLFISIIFFDILLSKQNNSKASGSMYLKTSFSTDLLEIFGVIL